MSFQVRNRLMNRLDNQKSIFRSALSFFLGTLCSRFVGFFREIMMAFVFGATAEIAAFLVAYRFANLGRRLFAEGALSPGIVPYFETLRKEGNKAAAGQFLADLIFSLSIFLILFIGLIELLLFCSLFLFEITPSVQEIIKLTMVMLPALFFLCLYGINSAILQCEQHYFLSSSAPAFYNIVWVAALLFLQGMVPSQAIYLLAGSILLAVMLQWLVTLKPVLTIVSGHLRKVSLFSNEVRALFKPLGYGLIGIAAMQINSALDAVSARFSSIEGPAYLWYSIRIEQLPLSLFAIALSSAILPPLARAHSRSDTRQVTTQVEFGLRLTFLAIIPATVAIFGFAGPTINFVYGRGAFTDGAIIETMRCLIGYGIGLLPGALVIFLAQVFYAHKNFRIPMQAAVISVCANLFLNALFIFEFKMDTYAVALSTSIAATLNCLILFMRMRNALGIFISKRILIECTQLGFFAASSAVVVRYLFPQAEQFPHTVSQQLRALLIPGSIYLALFFATTLLFSKTARTLILAKGNPDLI